MILARRIFYMKLNKYQANLVTKLFSDLHIGDDISSLEFSLSGDFSGKYRAAFHALGEGGGYIVFNIPVYGSSVFIGLAESDPKAAALILANLEDYERENSLKLGLGEVVIMPSDLKNEDKDLFGVVLLRTASSVECSDVPDKAMVQEVETSFFFAVPISRREYEIRRERGHDALMGVFEESRKYIFF
jgi:hypothetical protein